MENPESEKYDRTQWIEHYLLGELPDEELVAFTQRLQDDPAFQREVLLQRAIMEQIQEAGREEMRGQLKMMHKQLGFNQSNDKPKPFSFLMIAATLILLLAATFIIYFSYWNRSTTGNPIASSQEKTQPVRPQLVMIPFQVKGGLPDMGFSGTKTDTTIAVLLYPGNTQAYQFDDTLRLYGNIDTSRVLLQYDQEKEIYTLSLDSVSYQLQRFKPRENLN